MQNFPFVSCVGFFAACFVTVFVCFWSTFNKLLQVSKYQEQSPHHSYTEEEIRLSWKELSFTQNSLNQCIDMHHQHDISLCHCAKEDTWKYVSTVWYFTGHINTGLNSLLTGFSLSMFIFCVSFPHYVALTSDRKYKKSKWNTNVSVHHIDETMWNGSTVWKSM